MIYKYGLAATFAFKKLERFKMYNIIYKTFIRV